jgi:hypothetical protein
MFVHNFASLAIHNSIIICIFICLIVSKHGQKFLRHHKLFSRAGLSPRSLACRKKKAVREEVEEVFLDNMAAKAHMRRAPLKAFNLGLARGRALQSSDHRGGERQ